MAAVTALEAIESSEVPEVRLHLDLKNGTKLGQLVAHGKGSEEYKFWNTVLPELESVTSVQKGCLGEWVCEKSRAHCDCWVVPGFGPNVASQILAEVIEVTSTHKRAEAHGGLRGRVGDFRRVDHRLCCASSRIAA